MDDVMDRTVRRVQIGGTLYHLLKNRINFIEDVERSEDKDYIPIFVYSVTAHEHITYNGLQSFFESYIKNDDVTNPCFLRNFYFLIYDMLEIALDANIIAFLEAQGVEKWSFVKCQSQQASGPYVIGRSMTWEPWRVYQDDFRTLMCSLKSDEHKNLQVMEAVTSDGTPSMIVPSRCYSTTSANTPLNGCRIVVKDMFDIKNVKTSLCNRAWLELYSPKISTASCIQKLIDAGAIIIGKTKLNAMLIREETMECVDFLAPFNPRADGYQTSSGSSSGSCAALAGYEWLDMAIGSDTNGSCRKPAHWNGVFAMRPTHGVLETDGVVSFCPMFDVPAFFARDLSRFEPFAELWYGANLPVEEKVAKVQHSNTILVLSEYFPTSSPAQSAVIEKFIIMLEQALKTERTSISLRTEWKRNLPDGVAETDPAAYLEEAGTLPYYRESYERLEHFRTDYHKTFHKDPFVHKALRWRWDIARTVTDDQRDDLLHRLAVFKNWLLEHVLQASSSPGSVFVVLPIEDGKPSYRDTSPPPFELISGFHPLYMSTITGAPEITLPVGEVWFHSEITQRKEPLPVSVSLLSSPGSDLALIQAAMQAFKQGGKSTILATGRSIYKHGDTR